MVCTTNSTIHNEKLFQATKVHATILISLNVATLD